MKQGFIKVAAVTVDIRVADVWHNCKEICKRMKEAEKAGAKIIVFPEPRGPSIIIGVALVVSVW